MTIGSKIPVATGSYNAGVATGVGSIGVQTQFTYIDVGVKIEVTPTVHYNRDVGLKMHMEVSSQQSQVTISGVVEPVIGQNIVEQTIQLKEGEPSILAGLVTKQDTRSLNGTPGLSELPLFKFFFASNSREVQENEIVFLLIPHVVRESILTRLNRRAIDTGTSTSFELRHDPSLTGQYDEVTPPRQRPLGQPTTAANAAAGAAQQMMQQAQPPKPPPDPGLLPSTPAPAVTNPQPAQTAPAGPPISLTVAPPAGTRP